MGQQAANFGFGGSAFDAKVALIVTWESMQVTDKNSKQNDRTNTFQAVLTHDGIQSYVVFHYGDIEQDAGTWTNADHCTGLGPHPSWAAIRDEFGNVYHLPQSHTHEMENIEQSSNVNVRGRYVVRVDSETIIAPDVNPVAPTPTLVNSTQVFNGIAGFLEYKGFDYSLIASHGCYCSILDTNAFGQPADVVDKICRDWIYARRCSLMIGGACNGADATDYTAGTENCSGAGVGPCDDAACAIDEYWFGQLEDFFVNNPSWTVLDAATCSKWPSPTIKDHCCGSDPATMVNYSTNQFYCVGEQLFPF